MLDRGTYELNIRVELGLFGRQRDHGVFLPTPLPGLTFNDIFVRRHRVDRALVSFVSDKIFIDPMKHRRYCGFQNLIVGLVGLVVRNMESDRYPTQISYDLS